MGKARPGDRLIDSLPPAESWNRVFYGRGNDDQKNRETHVDDQPRTQLPIDPTIVKLYNGSGAGIGAGEVLTIGAKRLTTLERDKLWFTGSTPTIPTTNLWGCAVRPVPSASIGDFRIMGAVMCPVVINDAQHVFADIAHNSTTLESGWHGARIMYKPSGTGEKTCVLMLGELFDGPIKGVVSEVDGIDAGDTGSVTVWWGGAESDTPDVIQAKFAWMAGVGNAAEGAECLFRWVRDEGIYEIVEIEC